MASLKVFISSTCYDLHSLRGQLRSVMLGFGHEPIMSDQAEVIFDPQIHTHTSCLREVKNCDVVVLVVGSRFGGTIIPKALEQIDLEKISDMSRSEKFGEGGYKISITQAEILQAIQNGIPVFAFVDSGIMRDHLTYEKNKNKDIIKEIEFSSIDKPETAAYIFEFINFLRLRNENNSIFEFSRFEDIEIQLKKQWSGLFQRLLSEQRLKITDGRSIDLLSSQIADLKAAVLGSISSGELKETAKGAIRFRTLIDFTYSLINEIAPEKFDTLIKSNAPLKQILSELGIANFVQPDRTMDRSAAYSSILINTNGTHFLIRIPLHRIYRLLEEWNDFKELGEEAKSAIISAVLDSRTGRTTPLITHFNEPYIEGSSEAPESAVNTRDGEVSFLDYITTQDARKELIYNSLTSFINSDPVMSKINMDIEVRSEEVLVIKKTDDKDMKYTFPYKIFKGTDITTAVDSILSRMRMAFS
ncbi:DUF4062 domain-containing protein [Pseudomonas sp. PB101]|uniref:DUF4062 domain-containing protein n=1 Tax=Pseudomonas sp. PB101 TaxID=2495428 RepID=UPI0013662FC9|nr:DUF4062 domain-containing protein [Pseudomonas sp. PB101]